MGGYLHPQPGSRLVQCGMGMLPKDTSVAGGLPPNPSIIYNGYLANGKPVSIDPEVAQWLKNDGINKIIVGHQPNGDTPFTIDDLEIQVRERYRQTACPTIPTTPTLLTNQLLSLIIDRRSVQTSPILSLYNGHKKI